MDAFGSLAPRLPAPQQAADNSNDALIAAIRGALSQTLLRRASDDPVTELSHQRFTQADPLAFAMSVMGGPGRMGVGGKWNPLDSAEIYKQLALERRNAGGGGTIRAFKTQEALDASRRPLSETELALEKSKYGWRGDSSRALDDFRAATADYRSSQTPVEPDPFGPPQRWQPEGPSNIQAGRDLTAKQQLSLADLLKTFGIVGMPAGAAALQPQDGR